MIRTVRAVVAACLLACLCIAGQQQTGSPAGVPVLSSSTAPVIPGAAESGPGALHFRVRVLDGRTGTPIRNAHVKLWYDEPAGPGFQFATDARGDGDMPPPAGGPVRVLISVLDYIDCRSRLRGDPPQGYSVQQIAQSGLAAGNSCGEVKVQTRRGELVLFVRSPRWFEELNRNTSN